MYTKLVNYSGQILNENQWLLKVRNNDNVGFLTKLTQKNELPKAFAEWSVIDIVKDEGLISWNRQKIEDIFIVDEDFSDGWTISISKDSYRIGKSQQWVKLIHPLGFILEITMDNFFTDVLSYINLGKLTGKYKWVGNSVERQK